MRPRNSFDDALLPKVQRVLERQTDYREALLRMGVFARRTAWRVKRDLVTGESIVDEYDEVWVHDQRV